MISGTISIDGVDIKSLNLEWLRKNIGIVSQEPVLFSFSIRENIKYGAPEDVYVNDTMIENVLYQANAFDFVMKMPRGLDTVVGERGAMLSGTFDYKLLLYAILQAMGAGALLLPRFCNSIN